MARTAEPAPAPPIDWFGPEDAHERAVLAAWRLGVGAPVISEPASDARIHAEAIVVVSWNTAVGDADISALIDEVGDRGRPLVLLLQEVYRRGAAVPAELPPTARFAGRLGHRRPAQPRDVLSIARSHGLAVYYVPSMRNGGTDSDEDRGNAILSNVPLTALTAIELPFEHQRRVALAATIAGVTSQGEAWQVRVINVHLDNMAGPKRVWIGAEAGRARQARALLPFVLRDRAVVLGGDLNTWFGTRDAGYRELARAFGKPIHYDEGATRGPLRLDHMMTRVPSAWQVTVRRAADRFGSDHYPLIGTLSFH